jgi:adenylosuccinate synthase
MSKVKVKVVIGSNYGDEGKGLATHYFSSQSDNVLNVLFNGGSQRGHTVEYKNGIRMVFHHFGSGAYDGADTYFDQDFMVNPMTFVAEYSMFVYPTLLRKPICYVSPKCRFTTPFDMLLNQVVEILRDNEKHGSCGCGIWETQQRYELSKYNLTYGEFVKLSANEKFEYLNRIKDYSLNRLNNEYGYYDLPAEYQKLFEDSDGIINHYIEDFNTMLGFAEIVTFKDIADKYETIVFEGAQGLELDENNKEGLPHLTASSTGSLVPVQRVKNLDCDIEVCYITRSYFTRHGAGNFPTECSVFEIGSGINDRTNINNQFQDKLRYGFFNREQFLRRINKDIEKSKAENQNITFSLMVTHLNYTKQDICGNCKLADIKDNFDKIYLSSSRYAEDITIKEK